MLGYWSIVVLFVVVHGFFIWCFWVWMVFAVLVGMFFGVLVLELGTLLAFIVVYCMINGFNLFWL